MRALLAGSLGLALGVWSSAAHADDISARPRGAYPAAIVLPPAPETGRPASVSLGRPQALPATAPDNDLVRVSYSAPSLGGPQPLIRAQSADVPLPLPAGPGEDQPPPGTGRIVGGTVVSLKHDSPAPAGTPANGVAATADCWGCGSAAAGPPAGDGEGGPDCCGPEGCCQDGCGRPFRVWMSGEYLLFWTKNGTGPALVTTSPTTSPLPGVLGAPGTAVLFSGNDLNYSERSGARFTLGFWFTSEATCGLEGSYFFLGQRSAGFQAGSTGAPVLARPFFDAEPAVNRENAELVALPGVISGSVVIASTSDFWGTDLNFRKNLYKGPVGESCCCCRWDLLCGYRFLELDENLGITENLVVQGNGANPLRFPAGAGILVNDIFQTRNSFSGGQLGTEAEFRKGCCTFNVLAKVALGDTHEMVAINGNTLYDLSRIPGAVNSFPAGLPGGLLAQPSNIGRYTHDNFAVAPECGLKFGYQLTDCLRLTVGYTFVYLSDVARPGDQIDRTVNATQLPTILGPGQLVGPARPAFVFRESDYWAHGVSFGMECRY